MACDAAFHVTVAMGEARNLSSISWPIARQRFTVLCGELNMKV
jgi:hypothetical protein